MSKIFLLLFLVTPKIKWKPDKAVVHRGDIVIKVTESGKVEPFSQVRIKSDLSGEIKKLYVEEGDAVKEGDTLCILLLESSLRRQVAEAWANLNRAKIELNIAKRDFERKKRLFEKGFISQKEFEETQKYYENCKINYEFAKKNLEILLCTKIDTNLNSKNLDYVVIRAPVSGVVIDLNVEEGEIITSSTRAFGEGTILMKIANLSKMIVKVNVNEIDITNVKEGEDVKIYFDAIKGKVYHGKVKKVSVSGRAEQNIVVFPVEIEILDADSLIKPGMTADVDIICGEARNVLLIPKSAIIKRDGKKFVLKIVNGKPYPQPVITGLEDDLNVEIKEGLAEGDTIVLNPPKFKLREFRGLFRPWR